VSYLNFALELSALPAPGRYRISVNSPIGQTSVDVSSPFTAAELENYLAVFGRETAGITRAQETQTAREFGDRIFNFLIRNNEDVNAAYFASLERAGSEGLRIRLSVENAGELARLPWEFLRDPSREFLALSRSTPVIRYSPQLTLRRPLNITIPLRVLVMISAPRGLPELDVEGEWQRLQEATADLQARGLLLLERLDDATLIALQRKLRSNEYHVFHYIGHSDFNASTQQGVLVFEDELDHDKPHVITGEALGRELGEENTIRLVVLNSCHSARRSDRDVLAGIASGLVARGIPAIVAMQFAISDLAAKAFAEEFYRVISENLPIDSALSEARRAIANRVGSIEWATPVLYMRSEDGVLFLPTMTAPTTKQQLSRRTILAGIATLFALALLVGVLQATWPSIQRLLGLVTATPSPTAVPADLPDLQVSAARISPNRPAPGQIFRMSVTITNAGAADSGPFRYSWDASLLPPVLQNSFVAEVDNIPPGASKNVSFPFSYGWWGSYNSLVLADIDSQVFESDERNNRRPFDIALDNVPFDVDFTLLPSNEIVNPPFTLGTEEFAPWNLTFAVSEASRPDCATTSIQLVDVDGDIVLQALAIDPLPADCENQALSIAITRSPVSSAQVGIVPSADGAASLTYFADSAGTQPVFQLFDTPVAANAAVLLGPNDGQNRQIRRIDVRLSNQPARLTRLILSPPAG
jgi:hypothetical protein